MKSIASGRAEIGLAIRALAVSILTLACPLINWAATANDQSLTCSEMEEFLRLGKIGQQKNKEKVAIVRIVIAVGFQGSSGSGS